MEYAPGWTFDKVIYIYISIYSVASATNHKLVNINMTFYTLSVINNFEVTKHQKSMFVYLLKIY